MSEKTLELKPCPFCGKQPHCGAVYGRDEDEPNAFNFACPDSCSVTRDSPSYEQAIVIWNTRASSPAPEPVTTEPVAWTNEAQLGFLKEQGYRVVPMAMWAFQHSAHPIALYAIPAPPQPKQKNVLGNVCCYCDAPLSCDACDIGQPV